MKSADIDLMCRQLSQECAKKKKRFNKMLLLITGIPGLKWKKKILPRSKSKSSLFFSGRYLSSLHAGFICFSFFRGSSFLSYKFRNIQFYQQQSMEITEAPMGN